MTKQLIMVTAPFNCGYCDTAKKVLPEVCKKNGYELIEMQNENDKNEDLPVDMYPTIMIRVNDDIKEVMNGYNEKEILSKIKKY